MTSGRYYATSGTYSVFGGGGDVAWPPTGLRGSLGPSGPFRHTSCICPWTVVYFEVWTLTAILGSGCDSWVSPVQDNDLCFDFALVRDPVVSHTQEYALAHFCDLHCVVDRQHWTALGSDHGPVRFYGDPAEGNPSRYGLWHRNCNTSIYEDSPFECGL